MNVKKILFSLFVLTTIISCNKTDFNYPEDTVAGSRITYYADFTYNGNRYVTVPLGGTYVEPGVTATEKGTDIPVTVSGTVDTGTPGVYTLIYSAVNKDGFPASRTRTVVVYETDEDAILNDYSGNYARTTNGSIASWTKLAPGVYQVFNPGGAPGTNLTVIAFNPTGSEIFIPEQVASDGSVTSSDLEEYMNTTPPSYKWKIVNPGYGPAVRTFIKQ